MGLVGSPAVVTSEHTELVHLRLNSITLLLLVFAVHTLVYSKCCSILQELLAFESQGHNWKKKKVNELKISIVHIYNKCVYVCVHV